MKKTKLILITILLFASQAHGQLIVHDAITNAQQIASELKNYAEWLQQTENQVTQIENQISQIEQQGTSDYVVNRLDLNPISGTIEQLKDGIGQTLADVREAADGADALRYTASGLYSDISGMTDRFGAEVQWNLDSFRKFQSVNANVELLSTQQQAYNAQIANLQSQLATALRNLNGEHTAIETAKYASQVNAISAQMNALGHTTNATSQRLQAQQTSNANDAGRMAEAMRQREIQERTTSLQQEVQTFTNLIGTP
jgi:peptidoglycan hydrolase CwlO-like protein